MKFSKKMQDALNDQMTFELQSAYIYMGMSAWFRDENLDGFAKFLEMQAQEEVGHAMKIYNYIYERLGSASFGDIKKPKANFKDAHAAINVAFEHEQKVSASIFKLVDLAREESDKPTESFLQWFVTEQVEEESTFDSIIQRMKLVGDFRPGLFFLDRELGARQG